MNNLAELVGVRPEFVEQLMARLQAGRHTVAVAESLTAGLVTALLTEVPGSSAVVRGGLVVYATDLKHRLAGVDAALLATVGPVAPEVAIQLADGARIRCGASIGLGLTGVAGPDRQDNRAVGTVFAALCQQDQSEPSVVALRADGTRWQIRAAAVRAAIGLLAAVVALPADQIGLR